MTIRLARSAGFCFGVDKAVQQVNRLLEEGKRVATLGPIIHNPQMVASLTGRGVVIVDTPQEAPPGSVLVIRSHGVPPAIMSAVKTCGAEAVDATCPFVSKIHRIVRECPPEIPILIAGDAGHPEVIGIMGYCRSPALVFSAWEELAEIAKKHTETGQNTVVMVAQTTFNKRTWEKCAEFAKKVYTKPILFDTICNATGERQSEAVQLAKNSDLMIVVGGRHSSNTAKLAEVCRPFCRTVSIETADELDKSILHGVQAVGVTAGASTPADIIKEVLSTMSEWMNEENLGEKQEAAAGTVENVDGAALADNDQPATAPETQEQKQERQEEVPLKSFEEMTFEEALEVSLSSLNTDEKVQGIVIAIAPNEVQVEVVGRKQTGYIPNEELSSDPNANPTDLVKVGDRLELLIMRTNDMEGTIVLSKKRIDAQKGWQTVVEAEKSGAILEGVVTDVIKGGILVTTNGVRVFVPASQAAEGRIEDLSVLLRQPVRLRIIEVGQQRRRAVGSVRAVSREERKEKEKWFWEQAEVGQTYTGTVKSMTSYGAFIDIGGVDGMAHISELSWERIKHPSDLLKIGDTVTVTIRALDPEKKKISLTYRKQEDNPWKIFAENYPVGTVTDATIVGMPSFGAFARIIPGIDGLIHISQIAEERVEKPQDILKIGQTVRVKIVGCDMESKRISLSMRAAAAEEAEKAEESAEIPEVPVAETAGETPTEEE